MLDTRFPPLNEASRFGLEKLLSLGRRQHTHGLAVFGDGAAGDPDPLVAEEPDEILVAQRIVPPLGFDDLQDLLLHRLGSDILLPPFPVQAKILERSEEHTSEI